MGWCFGQDGDGEACDADRVEGDGSVVQIPEERDAEAVDERMRHQQSGIDANRLRGRGRVARAYGCGRGDESRATECDSRRDGDLTEQVEPARDPRVERGLVVRGQDGGPEVGTAAGGDGGNDLGHAEGDEEGEEADDDPADGHDAWSAC